MDVIIKTSFISLHCLYGIFDRLSLFECYIYTLTNLILVLLQIVFVGVFVCVLNGNLSVCVCVMQA